MIGGSAVFDVIYPESQFGKVQTLDKQINDPNFIVRVDGIIQ
jgi:hypothetical protein